MRGSGPIGEVLDVVGRLGPNASGSGHWWVTLASCLVVLAVGGAAARLARRSTPELMALLDRSAAFYSRWPEHRLAGAPAAEVAAEAARCQRIVELLEAEAPAFRTGAVAGLRTWIALLLNVIDSGSDALSGPAYA